MTVLTGMNVRRKNNKITDPLIAECVCNEGISAFFLFVCNIVKRCVILNPKVTTWGVIMKTKDKDQGIDFVIAWVDGNDPAWQEEKKNTRIQKGNFSVDDRKERYRDWDNLHYWFRGVEKYAPWVRKIHFVTWGHIPAWLDTANPKLNIVRHEDFIPGEFRPTFNSHTIEWNFHRIPNLSENFVYFNDDMFLLKPITAEAFFKNGKPVDMMALQPDVANADDEVMPYIYLNNAMFLAKYFDKRDNIKKQPGAYFHIGYPPMYFFYNMLEIAFPRFTGFYTVHGPSPLKKSTYEKLWQLEPELLGNVCRHPFRHKEDVNQYVLREYQKLSGDFFPENIQKFCGYYDVEETNEKLIQTITGHKKKMICINDSNHEIDFEKARKEINNALDQILPEKSEFERKL